MRLLLAIRCFFLILFARRLPPEAAALLPATEPPALPPPLPPPAKISDGEASGRGALQLLALLQREGRLVDFLEEDIANFTDAQIGAAVRDIHKGCRKVLTEHIAVEPVLRDPDNATVKVEAGFDPSRIRVVGNVVGEPPFTGTLKHPGWRGAKVTLPELPPSCDPSVIAPAEVELQ